MDESRRLSFLDWLLLALEADVGRRVDCVVFIPADFDAGLAWLSLAVASNRILYWTYLQSKHKDEWIGRCSVEKAIVPDHQDHSLSHADAGRWIAVVLTFGAYSAPVLLFSLSLPPPLSRFPLKELIFGSCFIIVSNNHLNCTSRTVQSCMTQFFW